MRLFSVSSPDDRERVNKAYTGPCCAKESRYRVTHRLQMPDGRVKHVHERAKPISAPASTAHDGHGAGRHPPACRAKLALERANRDLRLLSVAIPRWCTPRGVRLAHGDLPSVRGAWRLSHGVGGLCHARCSAFRACGPQSGDQDGYLQNLPVTWADEPHGRGRSVRPFARVCRAPSITSK